MTKQEFLDKVNSFGDLSWALDEMGQAGYWPNDVYDGDQAYSIIADYVSEYDSGWQDLRDDLNSLPENYADRWYRQYGAFDWVELDDDDYIEFRDDIAEQLDEAGFFDDEIAEDAVTEADEVFGGFLKDLSGLQHIG